jgi:hypothetical protein
MEWKDYINKLPEFYKNAFYKSWSGEFRECRKCKNEYPKHKLFYYDKDYTCKYCKLGNLDKTVLSVIFKDLIPTGYKVCSKCFNLLPNDLAYFQNGACCCKKCMGILEYKITSKQLNRELKKQKLRYCSFCKQPKDFDQFDTKFNICFDCSDKYKKYKRQYDKNHYNDIKDFRKRYYSDWKTNGGSKIRNEYENNRRELIKNINDNFSDEDWKYCLNYFDNCCAYCGKPEEQIIKDYNFGLIKEHVIPITRGGETIKSNILPSCNICNSKKKNKNLEEYFEYEDFGIDRLDNIQLYFKSINVN